MNVTRQLFALQEVDLEIEGEEQSLSQKEHLLGNRQALNDARDRLAADQKRLEELKHQRKAAEWEVDDLLNKVAAAEKKLYDGKISNPKELSSLQQDIASLKHKNDRLENDALQLIDKVEILESSVAAATAALKKMEDDWQHQQQHLSDEIIQLKSSLADLKIRRRQLAEETESEAILLYERIRKNKKPPISNVERGTCHACRISLSTAELQQTRSGQPVLCTSCGRILFLP